jgi:release factor glutamine methyltransferase
VSDSIAAALADARALGVARLDAQLLLAHVLGRSRTWVLAHDDQPLDPAQRARYLEALGRRLDDVPLAYLTGEREFRGLSLAVGPGVLVPRPETEGLVDWALECLQGLLAPRIADLGTGSGAIALALAAARPDARVVAVERSDAALAVARANGRRLGLDVDWRAGDWWQPLAGERFDLVVSNPPYVAEADPHLVALRHEPRSALASGPDGLADLRCIVRGAADPLAAGGWLLLEHGHDQGPAVRALLAGHGLKQVVTRSDLAGLDRCSGGLRVA